MIDNIKIRISSKKNQSSFGKCIEYKKYKNKKGVWKGYRIPSPIRGGGHLLMSVKYVIEKDITEIIIKGSWRKWYLGKGGSRDLTYTKLEECIKELAQATGLSEKKILNAKINNVELGFGLRFYENMGGIIDAFIYFKGFKPFYVFNNESIKFAGDAYNVLFYDKYTEIMHLNEKKAGEKEKRDYLAKNIQPKERDSKRLFANKMNKNNFSLRFEVKITKPSGCPPEFYKIIEGRKKMLVNTPSDILEYWNEILDGLNSIFDMTTFSEYNLDAGTFFLKNKGLKELSMYETYITASVVGGVRNYLQILMNQLKGNHRDQNIKKRIELLNNPPPELREALKLCRNKKELVFETKAKRILSLRK